jgi:hypothetical protein
MEIRYKYGINHAAALQMQRSLGENRAVNPAVV